MLPIGIDEWLEQGKTYDYLRYFLENNVGMLRQWLNEDRIKDGDRFVSNKDLIDWILMK